VSTREELVKALVTSLRSRTLKSSSALEIRLDLLGGNAVAGRDHDRVDVRVACHASLQRAQRHDHEIVLVLTEAGLSLHRQQADHLA
jgi:hypothetical protein